MFSGFRVNTCEIIFSWSPIFQFFFLKHIASQYYRWLWLPDAEPLSSFGEIPLCSASLNTSVSQILSGDLSQSWEADAAARCVCQYGNVRMNNRFRTGQRVGVGKAVAGDKWYRLRDIRQTWWLPILLSSSLCFTLRIDSCLQADGSQWESWASFNPCPGYYPVPL